MPSVADVATWWDLKLVSAEHVEKLITNLSRHY